MSIISKSSKFKDQTQHYVARFPNSVGARNYCPKILGDPGTLGTHANSSPSCMYQKNVKVKEERMNEKKQSKLGEIKNASFKHIFENVPNLMSKLENCYKVWSIWI